MSKRSKKPRLLLLFQNMHGWRGRLSSPVYSTARIYRANATYSRVIPYLEEDFSLGLAECSPFVAARGDHRTKFPTDHDWVRRAVDHEDWASILSFGRQADEALDFIGVPHYDMPHPVSFAWRRSLMIEVADTLRSVLLCDEVMT